MKDYIDFDSEYDEPINLSSEDTFSRISSYTISYSVDSLINLIQRNELELEPEFQRNFVWDKGTASLFIDSLLIGFPTPSIFFGRNSSREDFVVIDGLQRLKTIYFFVCDSFSNGSDFRLTGLSGRIWEGMTYSEIPVKYQRRLLNSIINATVVDDIELTPEVVHELFYRINTGGIPLTNQEVRNCIYSGPFNRKLHELNDHDSWRKLLGNSTPHVRLSDIESVLRIMALTDNLESYRGPMREFISSYQSKYRDSSMEAPSEIFRKSCDIALQTLSDNAFRKNKIINRTQLESILTAIGISLKSNSSILNLESGYSQYLDFMQNHNEYLISGSNSERIVKERVYRALSFIGE